MEADPGKILPHVAFVVTRPFTSSEVITTYSSGTPPLLKKNTYLFHPLVPFFESVFQVKIQALNISITLLQTCIFTILDCK